MNEAVRFHAFRIDPAEHQIEPDDRVRATYMVSNQCDCVVITDVQLTHHTRVDNTGTVTLRCEPGIVDLDGPLQPNEERQVTIDLVTTDHLPGRHALYVTATFNCLPVSPKTEGLFEFTVSPD